MKKKILSSQLFVKQYFTQKNQKNSHKFKKKTIFSNMIDIN